jgi:hypothetical protein
MIKLSEILNKILLKEEYKDLAIWWNNLSSDWKSIFKNHINIQSKPSLEDLTKIVNIKSVNDGNFDLNNLDCLYRLINLEKINLRNTAVRDLSPLKNLKNLKELDITFTLVNKLNPIWHLTNIKKLNCKRCSRLVPTEVDEYVKSHRSCSVDWDYTQDQNWLPVKADEI